MSKNEKGKVYYSFEDFAVEEMGMKPLRRVTRDKKRLAEQQDKFLGTCPYCKERLHYSYGTNIVSCDNPKCKGKKVTVKNDEGKEVSEYRPYFRILLGDNSSTIGSTIFNEEEKGNESE